MTKPKNIYRWFPSLTVDGCKLNCVSQFHYFGHVLIAMYDVICKRSLMFIKRCLYAESHVVRFIAQYGVLYNGIASGVGQYVLTYSRHYQLPASYLLSDHCTASKIEEICKSWVPVKFYNKMLCVLELMMIKNNIVSVPFVFLNRNDISVCISAVCSNRS